MPFSNIPSNERKDTGGTDRTAASEHIDYIQAYTEQDMKQTNFPYPAVSKESTHKGRKLKHSMLVSLRNET